MKDRLYIFLAAALILVGLGILSIYSAGEPARERKKINLTVCESQLHAVYQDLKAYADQHGGRFPAKLSDLVRAGYETQDLFVCPNSNDDYIEPGTPTTKMAADMDGPNRGSYEYYGAVLTESSPTNSVLIAEPPENHGPLGGHILYSNGNVVLLNPEDLQKVRGLLRQDQKNLISTKP